MDYSLLNQVVVGLFKAAGATHAYKLIMDVIVGGLFAQAGVEAQDFDLELASSSSDSDVTQCQS